MKFSVSWLTLGLLAGCAATSPAPGTTSTTPVAVTPPSPPPNDTKPAPPPRATAIAAGTSHTCALLSDGGVACWGLAAGGTLGEPVAEADRRRTRARRVPGVTARALAAGSRATCAIARDATTCWGENLQFIGPAGLVVGGTDTPRPFPGLADAASIGLATQLSCAVGADASLSCWGERVREQPMTADHLARFSLPGGAKAVASAGAHACAIAVDGTLHCLGANETGQLGLGDTKPRTTPTQVPGLTGVTDVATAASITCAVHDEALRCWGGFRCPGHGDCGVRDIAKPRPQQLTGLGRVRAVVLRQHGAVVLRSDGTVAETDVITTFHAGRAAVTPIAGLRDVTALTAGNNHVCALIADGQVLCWGANDSGELGDGTLTARDVPTPVDLTALDAPR